MCLSLINLSKNKKEILLKFMVEHEMMLEESQIKGTYNVCDLKIKGSSSIRKQKMSEDEHLECDKPFAQKYKMMENENQYIEFLGFFKIPKGSKPKRMSRRKF